MVGAILGVVFDDEDRRVVPVRTVRDGFDHAADREIVVRDRGRRARLAGRRAVGVIVRQIEQDEGWQLGSLAFFAGANKILKLVEEKVGAQLVRIFRVEIREPGMKVVPQGRLAGLHPFQYRHVPGPRAGRSVRLAHVGRKRFTLANHGALALRAKGEGVPSFGEAPDFFAASHHTPVMNSP